MSIPLEEIWMIGEFDQESALNMRKSILEQAAYSSDMPIIIYINSYGGEVDSLNSILETIDSVPNKVITVCAGCAMSCGAVLLAYGDDRYIGQHSRVMIHQVQAIVGGSVMELKNCHEASDKLNKKLIQILADRTGKSLEALEAIFNTNLDKYFTAKQAKRFGIVDKIGVPRLEALVSYRLI